MSESLRLWVEVGFDVLYLIVIWWMVILMTKKIGHIDRARQGISKKIIWAFILLATGDTGHVGFRVVAYALGGLNTKPVVFGVPISLVGIGAFATAVTITFFYMIFVLVWSERFKKPINWFGWLLLVAGVIRLIVMLFPQNQWDQVTPPYTWSLLRNAFLVIQGLGVMGLILSDSIAVKDTAFTWIGVSIALSYAFYAPVILWSAQLPLLGMLMIPKTCAYVAVALIAYRDLFFQPVGVKIKSEITI